MTQCRETLCKAGAPSNIALLCVVHSEVTKQGNRKKKERINKRKKTGRTNKQKERKKYRKEASKMERKKEIWRADRKQARKDGKK